LFINKLTPNPSLEKRGADGGMQRITREMQRITREMERITREM